MRPAAYFLENFEQEELDKQYSPTQWVRRMGPRDAIMAHVDILTSGTAAAKSELPCRLSDSYDVTDSAYTIHYFEPPSPQPKAPIAIYIHGGYWTAGILEDAGAFMARNVTSLGATLATLQYRLSPPNGIGAVVQSVRAAVAHVARTNPGRPLHVFGHSAGGHLSAMVLATDWREFGLTSAQVRICGAMLISGIFDLMPIKLSCVDRESSLALTDVEVADHSPFSSIPGIVAASKGSLGKVIVAVGGHESGEFLRQSREFEQALSGAGVHAQYLEAPGKDHFDVIEELRDPSYVLTVALRGLLVSPEGAPRAKSRDSSAWFVLAGIAIVAAALLLRRT